VIGPHRVVQGEWRCNGNPDGQQEIPMGLGMMPVSYARHRFPPDVICHAVWLFLLFTLSDRDAEELLAERGRDASYETIRRWVLKFGLQFVRNLRASRPRPSDRWHLDEMVLPIGGNRQWLWRAVDSEGEVLDRQRSRRSILTCLLSLRTEIAS
jgi:putative transposase